MKKKIYFEELDATIYETLQEDYEDKYKVYIPNATLIKI